MKYLILKVIHYNWGLQGPHDWSHIEFNFYDNTHVDILSFYHGERYDDIFLSDSIRTSLSKIKYFELLDLVKEAKNCEIYQNACDGEAWEFSFFIEGQKFYKIEARYIYGVKQLENLADFYRKLYRPELEKEISQ